MKNLLSKIKAFFERLDAQREADRKAAGIATNEEQRITRARWRASENG